MRRPVILAVIALFAASTGAAVAEHGDPSLRRASRSGAMAVDQLKQNIDALGYDLRSFEVDDGVFKTRIIDRQSGLPVKAKFDTASGELLRAAPGSE